MVKVLLCIVFCCALYYRLVIIPDNVDQNVTIYIFLCLSSIDCFVFLWQYRIFGTACPVELDYNLFSLRQRNLFCGAWCAKCTWCTQVSRQNIRMRKLLYETMGLDWFYYCHMYCNAWTEIFCLCAKRMNRDLHSLSAIYIILHVSCRSLYQTVPIQSGMAGR